MSAPLPPSLAQPAIGDGSFPAGTPIAVASPDGAPREVAVESLARGEKVLTLSGPIAVRHVAVAPAGAADALPRARLMPVRVAAGAFGEGQPAAELVLPPESLVHVLDAGLPHGALVPLGALVNGETIRRDPAAAPSAWVRLELESPGVVIAAGLLVAARLDPAAPPPVALLPAGPATFGLRQRFARQAAPPAPEPVPAPSAPVAESAPEAAPEAAALEEVASPAALRVAVDGIAVAPLADSAALAWHFLLPPGATLVRLLSPRGVPASVTAAERPASRRYGVAIRTLLVDDQALPLDGPAIGEGFHALESAGTDSWRWTAGDAALHLPPSADARRLTVHITDWHHLLQPDD
jgi:hypothetical protein